MRTFEAILISERIRALREVKQSSWDRIKKRGRFLLSYPRIEKSDRSSVAGLRA
jgi:hypothetical protein